MVFSPLKKQDSILGMGSIYSWCKSLDGEYFAGFTSGSTITNGLPRGEGLECLFGTDSIGGLLPRRYSVPHLPGIPDAVYRIFAAWQRQPTCCYMDHQERGRLTPSACSGNCWNLGMDNQC